MDSCKNCKNCLYFRKKLNGIDNVKDVCLRYVVNIEENYKCKSWIDQNKKFKCKKCGKDIRFAIYIPEKPTFMTPVFGGSMDYEVYTGTDYCLDCHIEMEKQMNKIFNLDNLWNYKSSQVR